MYDIVFISYKELNAEENFNDLYERFNTVTLFGDRVKRVKDVKGIHNVHVARQIKDQPVIFTLDGDAVILDDFNFDYTTDDEDFVHVYRSIKS